jgi:hypothetical protein
MVGTSGAMRVLRGVNFFFTGPRVLPCGVFYSPSLPYLNSSWDTTRPLSWRLSSDGSNLNCATRRPERLCLQRLSAANNQVAVPNPLFPTRPLPVLT